MLALFSINCANRALYLFWPANDLDVFALTFDPVGNDLPARSLPGRRMAMAQGCQLARFRDRNPTQWFEQFNGKGSTSRE